MAKLIIKSIDPAGRVKTAGIYRDLTGADLAEAVAALRALPAEIDALDDETAFQAASALSEALCNVEVQTDSSPGHEASRQPRTYETTPADNASNMPKEDILPILMEIDALSQEWHRLPIEKQMKENLVAGYQQRCEEIRNQVSTKTIAICIILTLLGLIAFVVPGILIFLILRPILYRSDREKNREANEREAERLYQEQIVPNEQEIRDIENRINELADSGAIEWAVGIVGEDIFESRSAGELVDLISSHRADTLKEALNLYDNSRHRARMEAEAAKQTVLNLAIEQNTHKAAVAAQATAVNSYVTSRNVRKINKTVQQNVKQQSIKQPSKRIPTSSAKRR